MKWSLTDLKFGMIGRWELVSFKNAIQFGEVAGVHGGYSLRLEHALVVMQMLTGWQWRQKARQPVHVASILQQYLTHASHLLLGEAEWRCCDVTITNHGVVCGRRATDWWWCRCRDRCRQWQRRRRTTVCAGDSCRHGRRNIVCDGTYCKHTRSM